MSEKRLTREELDGLAGSARVDGLRLPPTPEQVDRLIAYARAADDALREIEGLESGACPLSERAAAIARAHRLAAGREE